MRRSLLRLAQVAGARPEVSRPAGSACTQRWARRLSGDPAAARQAEQRDFMQVFPHISQNILFDASNQDILPLLAAHISECVQYTVPNGKKNRGYSVPASYHMLASPDQLTEDNIRLANILGWTVEFLQAFFLVADDIMDGSQTRRGQQCWYKKEEIGLTGFNDSILLESCVYAILKKYFRCKPYYLDLMELMLETTRHTAMGQALDLMSASAFNSCRGSSHSLHHFTMDRYNAIVKYKTSYYSFYLPVSLAMLMSGLSDPALLKQSEDILLAMGTFFQVQDDFLDCFGDPATTGKVGSDIQDGKCSWLVVQALQRASPLQKVELAKRYGSHLESDISWVKALYLDLDLPRVYEVYEGESYRHLQEQIAHIPGDRLPHQVFNVFLERIYKRKS